MGPSAARITFLTRKIRLDTVSKLYPNEPLWATFDSKNPRFFLILDGFESCWGRHPLFAVKLVLTNGSSYTSLRLRGGFHRSQLERQFTSPWPRHGEQTTAAKQHRTRRSSVDCTCSHQAATPSRAHVNIWRLSLGTASSK
jgi:hypothetical protein